MKHQSAISVLSVMIGDYRMKIRALEDIIDELAEKRGPNKPKCEQQRKYENRRLGHIAFIESLETSIQTLRENR